MNLTARSAKKNDSINVCELLEKGKTFVKRFVKITSYKKIILNIATVKTICENDYGGRRQQSQTCILLYGIPSYEDLCLGMPYVSFETCDKTCVLHQANLALRPLRGCT